MACCTASCTTPQGSRVASSARTLGRAWAIWTLRKRASPHRWEFSTQPTTFPKGEKWRFPLGSPNSHWISEDAFASLSYFSLWLMRGAEQDFPETRGLSASAPLFTFRSADSEIRIIMLTAFSRGELNNERIIKQSLFGNEGLRIFQNLVEF